MDETLASNAVYYGTGGEELHGLEAMKQLADTFINAFPDFHITIEDQIAEGDKVVSRLTFHGTHRGKMMGIAPTGKEVTWTAIVIHRIDGGKIVEEREIMDELYLMRQVGAVPAVGEQKERPTKTAAKPQELSGTLNVEEGLFQYYIEGNGIPCVVFTGSENLGLRFYSKELKKHLKLIHADPQNISSEAIKTLTLDDIIDDIEKVRNALDVDKIAVLGHSAFGLLPLEYALKYPQNISHAIVTGFMPFGFTEKHKKESDKFWESDASEERKRIWKENINRLEIDTTSNLTESDEFIRKYIADTPRISYDPNYDMSSIWDGIELNMNFLNHLWSLLNNFDNSDSYHKIKTPVFVAVGRYDYFAPYYLWNDVKDKIPDLSFNLFEHGGHNPMLEEQALFDKKLIKWIETH